MIAYVDMRPNLTMAAVVLIVGTCLLLVLSHRKSRPSNKSRIWLPLASLVAGPLTSCVIWSIDVFILEHDHFLRTSVAWSDACALLTPMLIIGTFVGAVASLTFAIALNLRHRYSQPNRTNDSP